jgi:hypothetical protein
LIQTYQYKIDGAQEGRASRFGFNKELAGEDVPEMFKNCMKYGSPEPSTRELRNTILLGHNISGDLSKLSTGKFPHRVRLNELHRFPILDTNTLYYTNPSTAFKRLTLGDLLTQLGVLHSKRSLHPSGNDSRFMMQASIALAVNSVGYLGYLTTGQRERCHRLENFRFINRSDVITHIQDINECITFEDSHAPSLEALGLEEISTADTMQ